MTNPHLTLEGVSFILPDGRTLFSDLHEQFDQQPVGLVGRNGSGKSVLARILAGLESPSNGNVERRGTVFYLPQQISCTEGATVATLAGVGDVLSALERLENGCAVPDDIDLVGERWDMRERLQFALERNGLRHLDATTPASALSGGEAMRAALAGAMLSEADFLILDEPSNHLDRAGRQALIEQLGHWRKGLLVISHDRQLLASMTRMVELSQSGLRSYGGNYDFYAKCKAREQEAAIEQLEHCKLERKREELAMRKQRERQEKRGAQGKRSGRDANEPNIALGRKKENSEASIGRLVQRQAEASERLDARVRNAKLQVDRESSITLLERPMAFRGPRRVLELEALELPFVAPALRRISLSIESGQRVGVVGPNGCGKSTLLKVLAGLHQPLSGICKVAATCAYLDQQLAGLDPGLSVLEHMLRLNTTADEHVTRMHLSLLGLDAAKINVQSGSLSGGERLKAALACELYADVPPQLLLFDEPGNHLDLPSLEALEAMLLSYRGTLIVVSHDDVFMNNLALTKRLMASEEGWLLESWPA